ncbi:hypothetical protein E0Z10_g10076 [Xylaria hypoxylon]|uniref:Uncharacterized protein n=1 Tax=Xylaria hypoxylon TaxID=37992 RepID=A0A4Z0YHF7_9PEZI|nr:hypothetical protein E0Z10_g10076 [Xylaria hypoxylon]
MSQMDGALEDQQVQLFMSRHPPWVNEQLGCVHDYLENRFSKATRDVLYHDIEFGELSIDYISNGPLNFWKQLWISQGIKFISRVENAKSHDDQQALLKFAFGIGNVPLHDALTKSYDAHIYDDHRLEDYNDEEKRALNPRQDEEDMDEGPFTIWQSCHNRLPRPDWVLCHDHARLRDRAYVLWDSERIREYKMLQFFEDLRESPNESEDDLVLFEAFQKMQHSFKERSKIWLDGGRGYWDNGDSI